jgi:uncharacterized protein YcfJ
MKTLTAIAFLFTSSAAYAERVQGKIEDHFQYITQDVPKTEKICTTVEVPVYGQAPASTGDTIVGAIIGGAIGNQFGNGSGKDAMTILGAIAGADVANKNGGQRIVGYTQETQCSNQTVYVTTEKRVYSHSTITFTENGRKHTVRFQK